jgi:RhtB (resistance to homoserine/threonine) family protein
MGLENFLTFVITALIFIMTPGIDTVFILNKSIGEGKKAGIYSTLGINTGILVHTLFAALGLSLIIAKSAIAFAVIKYLGAAYLIYLGISKLVSKATIVEAGDKQKVPHSNWQNFIAGLITNVLNPKVALFFLAFFPQFINPKAIDNPVPFFILGVTYAFMGVIWLAMLTVFASTFSKKLMRNPKASNWLNKGSGIVFILMGLKIALSKK